ncbi:uncharacterized protein LOC108086902 isoform X2 [Drosophila ficusphila]|uniref:uncharacterized protein LOC108086902 isoform X2 n=1 Tax=Drosophila ficusphila TaxID=30025 RepID=UPI0007E5E583|nr:uncharacterized protein LOC108086902 isoform X2 [Drosophila ficusphila]
MECKESEDVACERAEEEDHEVLHLLVNKQSAKDQLILARSRFHQERSSSKAQLPRGRSYKALTRVIKVSNPWGKAMKIFRHPVDPINGYIRPLTNIFGFLVPESLRMADWDHNLDLVVECVNVQRDLQSTITSIKKLQWLLDETKSL